MFREIHITAAMLVVLCRIPRDCTMTVVRGPVAHSGPSSRGFYRLIATFQSRQLVDFEQTGIALESHATRTVRVPVPCPFAYRAVVGASHELVSQPDPLPDPTAVLFHLLHLYGVPMAGIHHLLHGQAVTASATRESCRALPVPEPGFRLAHSPTPAASSSDNGSSAAHSRTCSTSAHATSPPDRLPVLSPCALHPEEGSGLRHDPTPSLITPQFGETLRCLEFLHQFEETHAAK